MSEHEKEELDHESVAREAAKKFLSRHDWRLISNEELASRVASHLPFTDAYWACYNVYSEVLYRACSDVEQSEQQEQGWTELSQYLFDVVWRYAPEFSFDKRKEVTDQALAETYYHLAELRNPNAFLTVATQRARNIIRVWRRDIRVNSGTLGEDQVAPSTSMPDQRYTDTELRQRMQECFKRALLRHPRAKTQLRVVWMKQIEGWDYPAIAYALERKITTVRMLHTRGLDQLRKDPGMQALSSELDLI